MPSWIRDQGAARAFDSPTASSSYSRLSPTKLPVRPKAKKITTTNPHQTKLLSHFATKSVSEKKQVPSPSWSPALYTNEGSSAHQPSETRRKRKSEIEEIVQSKKSKKSDKKLTPASKSKVKEQDTDTTNDAAIPSYLTHVFGLAPQSSLSQQVRTPRRKTPFRRESNTPAPAISPSKRKTLIVDSARDVAVQQHRQWQRSSSPLQPIDNVANPRSAQKKDSPPSRSGTRLTPSKLRHGYSMIAFAHDQGLSSTEHDEEEEEEEYSSVEVEDSPSPSAERQERAVATPKNVPDRDSTRQKKIYVEETQYPSVNRLFQQEMEQDKATSVSTDTVFSTELNSRDANLQKGQSLFGISESLSSPPPSSSTEPEVEAKETELKSSQTAPGGSFSFPEGDAIIKEAGMTTAIESYISEEVDEDERRHVGDETFKLPSSEEIAEKEEENEYEGDETQPLPWSPCNERNEKRKTVSTSERVRASWVDVGRVWSQVPLDEEEVEEPEKDHQASLHNFGFEVNKIEKKRKAVEMTNDIDFDSDEGLDSDEEFQQDSIEGDAPPQEEEDNQATQELPWEEEDEGTGRSSPFSLLPSEGDLDSQARQFLENL